MLTAQGISVRYGTTLALDELDAAVPDGTTLAVMGPSGSGKSTLLRVIAGLETADTGSVRWNDVSLDRVPAHQRGFGLMFQDYALFPHRDVAANVAFGLRMQGTRGPSADERVAEVLDLVGLGGYGARPVASLSGGEQQRVALARTLAPRPRLVLLDEPIGALDRNLRERLLEEMRRIFSQIGVTAIYVTHDRDEAFAIADGVAVMRAGKIVRSGRAEELWTDPGSEFTARFLGLDNVFRATVAAGVADAGWVDIATTDPAVTGIAVPASAVGLVPGNTATVESVRFHGGHYRVALDVDGNGVVIAEVSSHPEVGGRFGLRVAAEHVALLRS